jgi:hypothetical protein
MCWDVEARQRPSSCSTLPLLFFFFFSFFFFVFFFGFFPSGCFPLLPSSRLLAYVFPVFAAVAVFVHSVSAEILAPCPVLLALSRLTWGGEKHTFFFGNVMVSFCSVMCVR